MSGVITDQLAQGHGNGKAVWISKNDSLEEDARRDWIDIGNDGDMLFGKKKFADMNTPVKQGKGIMFTTYPMIRGSDGKRLNQLMGWLGKDFDGVIALDEAHAANNLIEEEEKKEGGFARKKAASDTAKNIFALTQAYPKARVLYVSATGATEVKNLGMLDRLGLWGPGTSFVNRPAFLDQIKRGGTAAMELVARDMKGMGAYISRSLSLRAGKYSKEGVTYRRLEHNLTDSQKEIYNEIARGWQHVLQRMDAALDGIAGEEKDPRKRGAARKRAVSQFWNSQQSSIGQVIRAMKMPSLLADIEKQLKNGNSAVIQLTKTDEAALNKAIRRMGEDDTYDDIDLTPKQALLSFLQNSFPIEEYHEVPIGHTDDGKPITEWKILKDDHGNNVINQEALAIRDELISNIDSIRFPDSPLDMLINTFGADQVAEVTGRSKREVTECFLIGLHFYCVSLNSGIYIIRKQPSSFVALRSRVL
ncbi:MAG: strawberry notch family protein [Synergistaceae bacterium]|nr:strawberry notch family protein [Synergistaceae bacterium]